MEEKKKTFQELLEEHNISFEQFYESCLHIDGQDIWMLYSEHLATKAGLERMVKHLNQMTGKEYAPKDIFTQHVYGL